MLHLNLRRNGSNIWFAPAQWRTSMGQVLTRTQVTGRVGGKRAVLLLHGYNNTEDAAAGAYSVLMGNFEDAGPSPYEIVIGAFMPLSQFKLGFTFARHRARKAGSMIAEVCAHLLVASLDVQTHSLGGMVALEALRHGLRCRNLIMSAPAVDDDALEPASRYGAYLYRASRILVAYSRHDPVDWPYRFASWDRMLGAHGPQEPGAITAGVDLLDCSGFIGAHSRYKSCPEYLTWWRQVAVA